MTNSLQILIRRFQNNFVFSFSFSTMSCEEIFGIIADRTFYKITHSSSTSDEWTRKIVLTFENFSFRHFFFDPYSNLYLVTYAFIKMIQPTYTTNKTIGKKDWKSFQLLFFDPEETLYGVKEGKLYKGTPPSDKEDIWLHTATLVGASGWSVYKFLFFDPFGILYGVENGRFHKRSPPTSPDDDWLGTSTLIGGAGWCDFQFLFFMPSGELCGVYQDQLYKGSVPTQSVDAQAWLAFATLTGQSGWSQYHFLTTPLRHQANSDPDIA